MDDLAFRSYATLDPAAPEGDTLNLAWTRDESAYLAVDLSSLLADELRAEVAGGYVDRYLVRDPYGEAALGPSVAAHFEVPCRVTCGAGVVSLLHALARLSPSVRIVGNTYPDFPTWVTRGGGTVADSAPLWFTEHPSLSGDAVDLGALCDDAARAGAIVIVDESNANYYPPAWSAVRLARDNLVVVRGFSKAYSLGGLRLAYCVASPALTDRIRTVIPPLLASSLSLRLGARVLALGDITAPLRALVDTRKREVLERLPGFVPASEHLPYVLSWRDHDLEARGIVGKRHPYWSGNTIASVYRLSVPLTDARAERFHRLVANSPC